MEKRSMKFVFFGTRELGARVLERLLASGYSPSLVVTSPDRPAGRKLEPLVSPVKKLALLHNLLVAQPEKPAELLIRPELTEAGYFVLAAYGAILPKALVELPPKGVLNVHPSLLPKYRGPSPERAALLAGDKKTGVTVMLLDEKVDHGPVLAQEEFAIPEGTRHEQLHEALGELGGDLLAKTIPLWLEGKIKPVAQNHGKATLTSKVSKEQGRIDWKEPAEYIMRQIRAYDPWPGTFTSWNGKLLKVLEASTADFPGYDSFAPGDTFSLQGRPAVMTGSGALVLERVQLEGRNPALARDFLLGHKDFIRAKLN